MPRRFNIDLSARKIMATFFWDYSKVICMDYVPRGKTITDQYYAGLIKSQSQQVIEKTGLMLNQVISSAGCSVTISEKLCNNSTGG